MFQEFETRSERDQGCKRLKWLREQMRAEGISVYLVPHADEYQNEYQPEATQRLAWLTGFTGSAGFAIVTMDAAFVFVDSRYTLQVKEQTDSQCYSSLDLIKMPPSQWLEENLGTDQVLGFDPWCITLRQYETYEKAAAASGATIKPGPNLIDLIWEDQPPLPANPVIVHPVTHAGQEVNEKLAVIQEAIANKNAACCLLTDPASICWAFNIRGSDVTHNPVTLVRALVPAKGRPELFIELKKLGSDAKAHLKQAADLHSPDDLETRLAASSAGKISVLCDPDQVPASLTRIITDSGGTIIKARDPVTLPRAIKNATEIEGTRNAHLRDGVAVTRFLCWLDRQPAGSTNEIEAAQKLETLRAETAREMDSELLEISFDTISGAGSNGAIVHYRVTTQTNRTLEADTLYLNDSGAQYADGTTDITRTIAIGSPPVEAIRDFTLVLKGHIALARARFPDGTRGVDIDVLARHALWQHGKDYGHGTGHGVGSYLNVHEGPQSISRRGMESLVPGMIISNEPGYYKTDEYGIRIENLVLVREAESLNDEDEKKMLSFETLTLAPIDRRLVDTKLLTPDELAWLNAYHARVREALSDYLDNTTRTWLEQATEPLT